MNYRRAVICGRDSFLKKGIILFLSCFFSIASFQQSHAQTFVFQNKATPEVVQDHFGSVFYQNPTGLAVLPSDNFPPPAFVVDTSLNRVHYNTPSNMILSESAQQMLSSPQGVAASLKGYVYVSSTGNHRVIVLKINQGFLDFGWVQAVEGDGTNGVREPMQIAVDDQAFYVIERGNNRVQKFTLEGVPAYSFQDGLLNFFGSAGSATGQFNAPEGIAVSKNGTIYVADTGNKRIQRFSATGTFLGLITEQEMGISVSRFTSLAIDYYGSVYVVDRSNCQIHKLTSSLKYLVSYGSCGEGENQLNDPRGIAINYGKTFIYGQVYITETTGGQYFLLGPDIVRYAAIPSTFSPLSANAQTTSIKYVLTNESNVTISIFDAQNNLKRTLLDNKPRSAGEHTMEWDGKDSQGNPVSEGNYTIKIKATMVYSSSNTKEVYIPVTVGYLPNLASLSVNPSVITPSSPSATLSYDTGEDNVSVRVDIYKATQVPTGTSYSFVKTLFNGIVPSGTHSISWNATDNSDPPKQVQDGTYAFAIQAEKGGLKTKIFYNPVSVDFAPAQITSFSAYPNFIWPLSDDLSKRQSGILYVLSEPAWVTVKVTDFQNNDVRVLKDGISQKVESVADFIYWNGTDAFGNPVMASGQYNIIVTVVTPIGGYIIQASQTVTVDVTIPVGGVALSEPYISPNGDGVKDKTSVSANFQYGNIQSIKIYDMFSNEVRDITQSKVWDGKDEAGQKVMDGEYFVRVVATTINASTKVIKETKVVVDTNQIVSGVSVGTLVKDRIGQISLFSASSPRFSRNGQKIAYTKPDVKRLCVANTDGTGETCLLDNIPSGRFSWSPDSAHIAACKENEGIYVVDVNTGFSQKIYSSPPSPYLYESTCFEIEWSPNESKIAFTENREGSRRLRIIYPDGTFPLISEPVGGIIRRISWDPSGEALRFEKENILYDQVTDIYRLYLQQNILQKLTSYKGNFETYMDPDISVDGKIVFVYEDPQFPSSGFEHLKVMNDDGTNVSTIYTAPHGVQLSNPQWNADGSSIVVFSDEGILIFSSDGSSKRFIDSGTQPNWSHDGRQIVYVGYDGRLNVLTLKPYFPPLRMEAVIYEPTSSQSIAGGQNEITIKGVARDENFESYQIFWLPGIVYEPTIPALVAMPSTNDPYTSTTPTLPAGSLLATIPLSEHDTRFSFMLSVKDKAGNKVDRLVWVTRNSYLTGYIRLLGKTDHTGTLIEATNLTTNKKYESTTNYYGYYSINVPPHSYYKIKITPSVSGYTGVQRNHRYIADDLVGSYVLGMGKLLGDASGDGCVNPLDFKAFFDFFFFRIIIPVQEVDFNGNGYFDDEDKAIMYFNYGLCDHDEPLPNPSPSIAMSVTPSGNIQFNSERIQMAEVHLNFDPTVVQVVDAEGNPVKQLTPNSIFNEVVENVVDNVVGKVVFVAARPDVLSDLSGVNLVHINFKRISDQPATITFDPDHPATTLTADGKYELVLNNKQISITSSPASLYFKPSAKQLGPGGKVKVVMAVSTTALLRLVSTEFHYDPSHLQIVDANEIPVTKIQGNFAESENSVNATTGTIKYSGTVPQVGLQGEQSVATFYVKVLRDGLSEMSFEPSDLQKVVLETGGAQTIDFGTLSIGNKPDTTAPTITNLVAEPEIFSPDGDGIEEETALTFTASEALSKIILKVKDKNGNLVRDITQFTPQKPYRVIWDGKDMQGNVVPSGIYTAEIHAFDWAQNEGVASVKSYVATMPVNVVINQTAHHKTVLSSQTDAPTKVTVFYGLTTEYDQFVEDMTTTIHTLVLNNLEHGQTIHFRVFARTEDDKMGITKDKTFTTLPAPSGTLAINDGASFTNNSQITLNLFAQIPGKGTFKDLTDIEKFYHVKNKDDQDFTAYATYPDSETISWTLPSGDGLKEVHVQYKDTISLSNTVETDSEESSVILKQIILDTKQPEIVSFGAQKLTIGVVKLLWQASDENGISKTKIYRSDDVITDLNKQSAFLAETSEFSFADTDLVPGTLYTYAIETVDVAGNVSPLSDSISIRAPTIEGTVTIRDKDNKQAEFVNDQNVTLNITATAADGFDVSEIALSTDGSDWHAFESLTDTKPWTLSETNGTQNIYVKFRGSLGEESGIFSDSIVLDTTPPQNAALTASPGTSPAINLLWSAPFDYSGVSHYTLYRAAFPITAGTKEFADVLAPSLSGDTTSFIDSTGTPGDTYYYALESFDRFGLSSLSNSPSARAILVNPLQSVTLHASGDRKNVSIGEIVTMEIEGTPGLGAVQVALVDGSKPFDSGTIGSTFGASEYPLNSGHYHGFVSLTHDIPFKTIKATASATFGNFTNPVVSSNALCIGCAGALTTIEVSLNPTVIANNPTVNFTNDTNSPPVMVKRFTAKGYDAFGTEVPLGSGFSFLGLQAVSAEHPSDSWSANIGTISLSDTPAETYLTVPVPVPPPNEPPINPYWTQVKSSDLSLTLKNPDHLDRLVATSTQNTTPSYVGLYHDLYGTTFDNGFHTMAVQTRQKVELEAVLSSASVQDGGAGLMLGLDNLKTSATPIGRPNTLFFGALNGQSAVFKLCDDNGVCETKTLDAAPPDENAFHSYRLVIHPIGAGNFKRVTELYSANASFNKATPNFLDEHTLIFSQATQAHAGTSFAPPGIFRMNEFDAQAVFYTNGYDPALSVPLNKLVFLNNGRLYWMYPNGSFPCRDNEGNLTQPCAFSFGTGFTESPTFSKDGSKLAFYHSDSNLQNAGIFLYDFNTNQHTKVTNENLYPHPFPNFSHDGQSLLYYVQEQGRPKLILADFSGNILNSLTSLDDPGMYSVSPTSRAATSSDGKYIYYPSGINWTRMLSDGTGKEPFWSPLGYLGFPADDLTFLKGTDKIAFVLKPSFFTTGIITKRELTVGFENDPQIDLYYDNETGTPDDTVYLSFHNSLPQYGLHASSGGNEPLKAVFDNISLLGIPPFSDDFSSDFYVAKSEGAIKGKAKIFFGSDSSPPSHITDLSAAQGTGPKVFLSWSLPKDDNEVYGYRVYKSREPITEENLNALSFSFFSNYTATPSPKYLDFTSLIDPGVSIGDTWYYALQAMDTSGNIASLSNVAQVTITSSVSSPEIIANVLSSKQAVSNALVLVKQGTTVLSQTTDAQGYARFPVAEGSYVVVAKKQGYTTPSEQTVMVSATDTKKLSFSLSPYTNHIQGKVSSNAMPLSGATLVAYEALKGDRVEVVSKADGTYDIPVDIGLWKVTAEKAGYITQQVNVNLPQDACFITGTDFELVAYTSKIKGVVTNENGQPLANTELKADGAFSMTATTDETGNYEMTVAPATWIVNVQKYGFAAMPAFEQVVVENNGDVKDNVNFTLVQLPINRVTVSGTEDGTPQTVSSGEHITITAYGKENQTGLFAFFVDEQSGVKIHNESMVLMETQPGVYTATAPLPPIAVAQVRARVYWTQTDSLLSENVLTLEDTQPPTVPTNLTAELSPDLSIALNWERSSDNVGMKNYVVLRHTETITQQNLSQAKVLTNTLTGLETFYTDTEPKATSRYYYAVLAKDYAGNASPLSNVVNVLFQDMQPPSAVSDLQAVLLSTEPNQVQLTWTGATDNVGVVRYKILRIENEPVTDANKLFATILTNTLTSNTRNYLDATVEEGKTYYYAVTSFDAAGNESALSNSPYVTIPSGQVDTVAPVISNVIPPDNTFINFTKPIISATVTDDSSGVNAQKVFVKIDDVLVPSTYDILTQKVTVSLLETQALTEAPHTLKITAMDNAGNSATSQTTFTVDITTPVISMTYPLNNSFINTKQFTVTATLTDMGTGIEPNTIELKADGIAYPYSYDETTGTLTYPWPENITDGAHEVTIDVKDKAGNAAQQTKSTFTLDTTPPQITNITDAPDPISSNNSFGIKDATTLTADIIEDNLQEWKIAVKDASGTLKEFSGTGTPVNATWNGTNAGGDYLTDGLYGYVITAKDKAGNEMTAQENTVTIDNTNPNVTVEILGTQYNAGGNLYVSGTTQLTIKGNDPLVNGVSAGIEKTQYAVDQQQTLQDYTTPFTLQEGPHTVRYSAQDFAGNTSAQQFTQMIVDAAPPVTTLSPPPQTFTKTKTFTLTASDPQTQGIASGVKETRYKVDGGAEQVYTSGITLSDGYHTVEYFSIDNVGNEEQHHVVTFTVDTTNPEVTNISDVPDPFSPGASAGVKDTNTISANVNDANPDTWQLKLFDFANNPVQNFSGSGSFITQLWNGQLSTGGVAPDGLYAYSILATDKAGNTNKETSGGGGTTTTLLQDDFNDGVLDSAKWTSNMLPSDPGLTVTEENGELRITGNPQSANTGDSVTGVIGLAQGNVTKKLSLSVDVDVSHSTVPPNSQPVTSLVLLGNPDADALITMNVVVENGAYVLMYQTFSGQQGVLGDIPSQGNVKLTYDPASTSVTIYFNNELKGIVPLTIPDAALSILAATGSSGSLVDVRFDNLLFTQEDAGAGQVVFTLDGFITVDNTNPVSTLTPSVALFNNQYAPTNTTYAVTANDPIVNNVNSGIEKIEVSKDTETYATYTSALTLDEGKHTLKYKATDNAGNTEQEEIFSVDGDGTPPASSLTPSAPLFNSMYAPLATTYALLATDPVSHDVSSGVLKTVYKVDGGAETQYSSAISLTEGEHTIAYFSKDNVLNTEAEKTFTVKVDNTPPVTQVVPSQPLYADKYAPVSTTYTFTANDPQSFGVASGVSKIEYTLDGGVTNTYTGNPITLTEGIHTFVFFATDNVANKEEAKTFVVHVDNTSPAAQISSTGTPCTDNGKTVVSAQTQFTLTATDPVVADVSSGVKQIQYRINAGAWQTYTAAFTLNVPDGEVLLEFYAVDNVGNSKLETPNSQHVVLDTTPPVAQILSPQDKSVVNNTIAVMGTVTDTHFNAVNGEQGAGNSGSYTVAYGTGQNPTSYTNITSGTTQNTCTAQSASCDPLATWNTNTLTQNTLYTLKLTASDCAGNIATSQVTVKVGTPDFRLSFGDENNCQDEDENNNQNNGNNGNGQNNGNHNGENQNNENEHHDDANTCHKLKHPVYLAADAADNVYVTQKHSIEVFGKDGAFIKRLQTQWDNPDTELKKLKGIVLDAAQNIFVVTQKKKEDHQSDNENDDDDNSEDNHGHKEGVAKLTSQGVLLSFFGSHGNNTGEFNHPTDVILDALNNIYVVDTQNNRIQKFTSSGVFLQQWTSVKRTVNTVEETFTFKKPSGIVLDAQGNLIVSDTHNNRIMKFSQDGILLRLYDGTGVTQAPLVHGDEHENDNDGTTPLKQPLGLILDTFGNLYVADSMNHRVQKFDPWGNRLLNFGEKTHGHNDGDAGTFNQTGDVLLDTTQKVLIVSDTQNNRIQTFAIVFDVPPLAKVVSQKNDDKNTIIADPNLLNVLRVFPYPSPTHGKMSFNLDVEGNVTDITLEVYTINGKRVLMEYLPALPAPASKGKGKYKADSPSLDAAMESLPNGVYVYRLQISNGVKTVNKTGKFVVVR